ncbi:MAG: type II toxin-antitoxin system VapC family toxin [Shimia sp.]
MKGYLLDTNLFSEMVVQRPDPHASAFLADVLDAGSSLSVVTQGELRFGIERMPEGRRRAKLFAWVTAIETRFAGRILPLDGEIMMTTARIRAVAERLGRPTGINDAMIAGTAMVHDLTVATRNTRDFEAFGVSVVNPWAPR